MTANPSTTEIKRTASPLGQPHQLDGRAISVTRGRPRPLGPSRDDHGVNFAVVCGYATTLWIVLARPDHDQIELEIQLDPLRHRTGDHWHVHLAGLPEPIGYGFRALGPTHRGQPIDPTAILIDPYAGGVANGRPWGHPSPSMQLSLFPARVEPEEDPIDEVQPPRIPWEDTILYELHVRGYTIDDSAKVDAPGTFNGLTEKLHYLKELGITAIELMPIDEFDENDCPFHNPLTGQQNNNYWGYNTIAYGAPKAAYTRDPQAPVGAWPEFRNLVRAAHRAGIEVVLDVVYNHTAEGNQDGPTLCFRGLDQNLYYMVDDHENYMNFTGCGNTVNTNAPLVRNFMVDRLRDLVERGEVDGFRFDLAAIHCRADGGKVLENPPVVEELSGDGLLRQTKLIAEPWDAAGLYLVGNFPQGHRWREWNDRFRDDIRRFWRGDPGMTPAMATRICGSQDLYDGRSPLHSVNFITSHDGFTLADLISFNEKHNEANGEGNRDGHDANYSWNCGAEGPTDKEEVLELRRRQARNLMATLLISQGVPMILGGDEFLRTQEGNNNAWCQDNPISWVDWTLAVENADFLRFTKQVIQLRQRHPSLRRRTFLVGEAKQNRPPDIIWHGTKPCRPDFSEASRALAFTLDGRRCDRPGVIDRDIYIAMNAYWEPLTFQIPASPSGRPWRRVVDTSLASPEDAVGLDEGPVVPVMKPYTLQARSMIILVSDESLANFGRALAVRV